ncbi:MAG: GNAT family N-acetyltransferase [Bacteroidaceae bacterium]|nr:GNAT family N-acetyltransferase [Bacteroidaceae bacterium]MBR7170933.1 GNAT family N-acetyltransferase [Prevotella sp.]
MGNVCIKSVSTRKDLEEFIKFPITLYAGNGQFVPEMANDVRDSFNPDKNHGLSFTEVQAFIAERDGKVVGRIAGIINSRANKKWNSSVVRFGYIDFIDDLEVSKALLDTVVEWGRERGMTEIQGPLGITDFDKEGMLVEDFDRMGSMIDIYNYPYYPKHMEAHGYSKITDWVQIRVEIPSEVPQRYARVAKLSSEMYGLKVRKVTLQEAYNGEGRRVFDLMNQAYAPLFGYSSFTPNQVDYFLKMYLPVADMELIPLVENDKGELVAAAVTMASMSKALQKSKGKLFPVGWWHMFKALKLKHEDTVNMMLIAVRPDMQGLGVNALIFNDLIPVYNKKGYKYAETGPQLEDNVKELSQWKPLNPEILKRRRCYGMKID